MIINYLYISLTNTEQFIVKQKAAKNLYYEKKGYVRQRINTKEIGLL